MSLNIKASWNVASIEALDCVAGGVSLPWEMTRAYAGGNGGDEWEPPFGGPPPETRLASGGDEWEPPFGGPPPPQLASYSGSFADDWQPPTPGPTVPDPTPFERVGHYDTWDTGSVESYDPLSYDSGSDAEY